CGFLPWQLDLPWIYIYSLYKLGAVRSYHDSKPEFLRKYLEANQVKEKPGQRTAATDSPEKSVEMQSPSGGLVHN
ncbi:MAG TPA: hypothetical protein VGB46_12905, partial [Flavisolibacter sp.]